MAPHDTSPDPNLTPASDGTRMAIKIAVVESVASWLVRRAMESGYRKATGQAPPTARDQAAPLRRILVWAAVSAAAVAVANAVADRVVLRESAAKQA